MKRFLAIVLSMLLVLSLMPTFAFAGGMEEKEATEITELEKETVKEEKLEETDPEKIEEEKEELKEGSEEEELVEEEPFDVETAFKQLFACDEETGRAFVLALTDENKAALKAYVTDYTGEELTAERKAELLSWFEEKAPAEEETPKMAPARPKLAAAPKGPAFTDYDGTMTTLYGTFTYHTSTYHTSNREVTFNIYVNGALAATYYPGDVYAGSLKATFAAASPYHVASAKVTHGTWGEGLSGDKTSWSHALTLNLAYDDWTIDLYLTSPYTVTVNYAYPDNSENNSDIETLASYTKTVYQGEEFKSNEWKYYDAADARNSYTATVKNETTGKSVDVSGTAWGGYYFKDTINADTTYTVTLNPTNEKDEPLAVDAYLYRGGNAVGFDIYMDTTFKYSGYNVSDKNGSDQVYILKDGALAQPAASNNSIGDPTVIVQDNVQYKFHTTGIGLNFSDIKDVYYDSSDQNWYYVYINGPVVIPPSESGRINFVYKEYESDHELIYDANGGANAPATQTKKTSQHVWNFTVSSAEPTRDGFVFLGWADAADATEATYHGGSTIGVTDTKTIYAVWKQEEEIDKHVTLTPADVIKTYDSKTHTAGTATAVDDGGNRVVIEYSVDGINWVTDPATIKATDVADSKIINVRASVPPVVNSAKLLAAGPGGYSGYVTATQQLTIEPREVTVTGDGWTGDQPYTGSEYSKTTYSFENVLDGQTATITYSIKGKDIGGPYTGVFGNDFKVMDGTKDVTANYTLTTKTPGTLTISAPETKELKYTVKYVVDSKNGTVLKSTDKTVDIPETADTYSVASVPSESFTGYKVKTEPTLPATVEDGDIIYVIYEKDLSQTKELHYAVKYVVDSKNGTVLEGPVEKTVSVWINDTAYEVTEVENKTFDGYKKDSTDPALPAEVEDGDTIYAIYVKDASQTKKLTYTVQYIADDDTVLASEDKTVDIWVNDDSCEVSSVDSKSFDGYKVKTEPTLPTTVSNGDTITVVYEKDASQTKELTYSVKYVVDSESGTVLESADKTVDIWVNDDSYEVTEVEPKSFEGYKLKTNPTLPATVSDGDTVYVIYEKDASQTKKLTYSVKYVVDSESGTVLATKEETVDIWVNDDSYEVTEVESKSFDGYKVKTNPSLPAEVEDKDVLYVIYEKDAAQTKKLSYTVKYVVDSESGTVLATEEETVDIWLNDDSYEVTEVESKSFDGFTLKTNPTLPAEVEEGDVLYVIYKKDAGQTKKLNYTVKYVVGAETGAVLESADKSADIWAGDDSYEVTEIESKTFVGYILTSTPALPVTVEEGDVLYVIYDESFGSLAVSKAVTGDLADKTKAFTFKVELDVDGSFPYTTNTGVSGTISSGGTLQLKHGEKATINGIPAGTEYTVTESGNSGYRVYSSDDKGVILPGKTVTAAFTNAKSSVPGTGDESHTGLWACLMAVSLLGMGAMLPDKQKKALRALFKNR